MLHVSRHLKGAAAGVLGLALTIAGAAADPIKFDFWYGFSGDLSNVLQTMCSDFNKSQTDYQVVCTSETDYATNLQNTIAAYRANKQPTITQIFDIGTLSMLLSQAYYPVDKLMADNGYKIDWANYFPGISAYYATSKGEMNSLPLNSSTAVLYWNEDAFQKAGLTSAPQTWEETASDMQALKKAGYDCPMAIEIDADDVWQLMEQFSAVHGIPVATLNDGYDGLGARVVFNQGLFPKMVTDLKKWYDAGLIKIKSAEAGEDYVTAFADGHCQMTIDSIGDHGTIGKTAAPDMHWATAMLPVYAGTDRKNSLVGGASLWVLRGKSPEEYKAAAAFLNWLSQPQQALFWSTATGYIPVTKTGYDFMTKSGFYDQPLHKGREVAIQSLTASTPTPLTRGMRLGGMPEIRAEVGNALQAIFANQVTVQQGLDTAADRSNAILAKFEETYHNQPLP
jgi:sn-glycerol 3-phosphate transport system substrate-binding protein